MNEFDTLVFKDDSLTEEDFQREYEDAMEILREKFFMQTVQYDDYSNDFLRGYN